MAALNISSTNLQYSIDLLNSELKNSNKKFEELDDILIDFTSEFRSQKSGMKDTLNEIHCDLLRKLKGVNQFEIDEDLHVETCKSQRNEFNGVLEKSRKYIDKLLEDVDALDANIKSKIKTCKIKKESTWSGSEESLPKSSNKPNLFILHSRQTEEPFIVMTMKTGSRYKCSGCNQNIPIQSLHLSHIEEFPAGSKTYIPHSYHISPECLFQRGFEANYLKNTNVTSNESINKDIICVLREIGFNTKNMHLTDSNISDSDNEWNDSDDFPDNISEMSSISNNPNVTSSNAIVSTFTYHRKPPNQKKTLVCHGCKLNIDTETYITFEDKKQSLPFHVKKLCLKEGEVLPDDFSRTICKVYKLLKTHIEIKELIACGFYYNKILGFRPPNPNVKRPFSNVADKQSKLKGNQGDKLLSEFPFIFNEEPFILERLPHGEKCKGCQNQIKKDEMSLRHKERVPRDKLNYSPLISQYYHANRQCLLSRGFTIKYLSFIKCNAILAGDDNLSKFTDVLIKCGFYNENIVYNPKGPQEPRGFEVTSQLKKPVKEYKLFIDNCSNSSSHCEGCGFILIPNQPCFIYALTTIQDSNAKMFHIRSSCLKAHFTKEQLIAMTCINNNIVDVSPNEIINCGIVKIVTDNQYNSQKKQKSTNDFNPKVNRRKQLFFDVDIVVDNRYLCFACKQRLVLDKYVIKMKDKVPENSQVHLDASCIRKLGFSPAELARSKLSFTVFVSPDGLSKLHDCGFRNLPSN